MEPTVGDVVKSSSDLRVAMLRQEFVDELVRERTLKEEFLSVFTEENKILQDLKDAEKALEEMGEGDDPDAMQEILDRMQDLQNKAEDKDVYAIESRTKKVMDLMGFSEDEGDDLVASFSGGWKMRIGLGKVLLKDPNVLLLGEYDAYSFYSCRTLIHILPTYPNLFLLFQTNIRWTHQPLGFGECRMARSILEGTKYSHGHC